MLERALIALALIALGLVAITLFRRWHWKRASRATAAAGRAAILYFLGEGCAPCVTQGHFLDRLAAQLATA